MVGLLCLGCFDKNSAAAPRDRSRVSGEERGSTQFSDARNWDGSLFLLTVAPVHAGGSLAGNDSRLASSTGSIAGVAIDPAGPRSLYSWSLDWIVMHASSAVGALTPSAADARASA